MVLMKRVGELESCSGSAANAFLRFGSTSNDSSHGKAFGSLGFMLRGRLLGDEETEL